MLIQHVEIGNFRKLKAVRIDFAEEKTVFVGANNSGKTSAMVALRRFLVDSAFSVNDLTLSHWKSLNDAALSWEKAVSEEQPIPPIDWIDLLPFLDVWLNVEFRELHYVQKLLPTLDWGGGLLGVRLRYQPKDAEALQREFLKARAQIVAILEGASEKVAVQRPVEAKSETNLTLVGDADATTRTLGQPDAREQLKISLWPQSMIEFLERRMRPLFTVRAYLLNPARLEKPRDGLAVPQRLAPDDEPIEGDPFKGLIVIDEISAQRGLGNVPASRQRREDETGDDHASAHDGRKLSTQLRSYYANHLDPYDTPEPKDLDALHALEAAGSAFDTRLKACFADALKELEDLGYPGITDPKLTVSTRIRATDSLNHSAAVQYEVPTYAMASATAHRLPEDSNGLGYQNLVSMVFGLMSFRDAWMKVGKAGKSAKADDAFTPPLHLVLVEEPEAHLHAQVQQVFIKQAYAVLRNHPKLKDTKQLRTQFVVSTHSSHVAHACDFACLRYFRRLPAPKEPGAVPVSSVVNLSEVFGGIDKTEKFVTRYLKVTHCDLFFADGAVLIEGPAERILIPHFVEERAQFEYLRRAYLTWLEIGGSHAHRLRRLVEHLGITTLIITDLDAMEATSTAAVVPKRGENQRARNETLKSWLPATDSLDALLDKTEAEKVLDYANDFSIRVAYQGPTSVAFKGSPAEALANTFEDALLYENISFFTDRSGTGLAAEFRNALIGATDLTALAAQLNVALKKGGKAEFALDLLYSDDIAALAVPTYIREGLAWLVDQLKRKEREAIGPNPGMA